MNAVDIAVAALLLVGSFLSLLAAVGILRMPDLYTRMQSATKAGTLGVACVILAAGIHARDAMVLGESLLVIIFLFITSPVASHLIARAAYCIGVRLWEQTIRDDMSESLRTPADAGGDALPPPREDSEL